MWISIKLSNRERKRQRESNDGKMDDEETTRGENVRDGNSSLWLACRRDTSSRVALPVSQRS